MNYSKYSNIKVSCTDFLPNATKSVFQDTFDNFKLGWFICYNIESYNGDEHNGRNVTTSAPSVFTAPSVVDVHAWATLAASSGKISYALLTVSHIYGFSLYDHKTAVWTTSQTTTGTGYTVPDYDKYDVGSTGCTADKNIVTKFISEFNAVGIKPIFYLSVGWARNWCGEKWVKDQYTDPLYQFTEYHRYIRARLQELASLNPFAFWIDVDCYYAPGYQKDLYNAIKTINPDIGVIVNVLSNRVMSDNSYGPFDGASVEENQKPALSNDVWWGQTQTISGITYPCVKELVVATRESFDWFYYELATALRPLAEIQAEYDYAKAAGVPCCVSINPKLDGVIDQDQADLIASIVL